MTEEQFERLIALLEAMNRRLDSIDVKLKEANEKLVQLM